MLHRAETLPEGFTAARARDLHRLLPGPTLFDLPGPALEPLFLTVLLHGNEETGFEAVKRILDYYAGGLPRPLLLFVGNIEAAASGVRTLPHQHDFNRVWPGGDIVDTPEARMVQEVVDIVAQRKPFASLDIHNNTGINPHYACVNDLADPFLHLARLFSRVVVYFTRPRGVQSLALAPICPAATVECGRTDDRSGIDHAVEFINACFSLNEWPTQPVPPNDIDLLETRYRVRIPPDVTFSFDGSAADIAFRPDLDHLNFSELEAGTVLGQVGAGGRGALEVEGGDGADLFDYSGGELRLARRGIPSMLTRDAHAVRLDCLCYFMQRIDREGRRLD